MPIFAPFSFLEQKVIVPGLDPDAQAFIDAAGITDATQQSAINTLVVDLKGAGIWTSLDIIYPFVGGTATTHKYNLKDPRDLDAAYRLGFNGTFTHNSNGITGNGTDTYGNTYLSPSNVSGGQNDIHISYYMRSYTARNGTDAGSNNGTSYSYMNARNAGGNFVTQLNGNISASLTATALTTGYFTISRQLSTSFVSSINKSHTTNSTTSVGGNGQNMYLMAYNNNGTATNFMDRNMALFTMGAGLSTAEVDDLVDINETFQTTLGRFV